MSASRSLKIAIIGLSTLEATGIKALMHQRWEYKTVTMHDFPETDREAENYFAFVVSGHVFIDHLEFFMPRRQRTIVIDRTGAESLTRQPSVIGQCSDEADILNVLNKVLFLHEKNDVENDELSQREIEVLKMVATGMLNKEIADKLCISVNTVITHRKNISAKLGVKSASAFTTYAIMNGLL